MTIKNYPILGTGFLPEIPVVDSIFTNFEYSPNLNKTNGAVHHSAHAKIKTTTTTRITRIIGAKRIYYMIFSGFLIGIVPYKGGVFNGILQPQFNTTIQRYWFYSSYIIDIRILSVVESFKNFLDGFRNNAMRCCLWILLTLNNQKSGF